MKFLFDLFKMSPLNIPRAYLGCTVCNGRLYAVGGLLSEVVEEYDFKINKWKQIAPFEDEPLGFHVFTIKNDRGVSSRKSS